jgi:hypothetical protein
MMVVAEVTPCHKSFQLVGVWLGGTDSNSSGQPLHVHVDVAIEDARDAKNYVPLQVENKLLNYRLRNE